MIQWLSVRGGERGVRERERERERGGGDDRHQRNKEQSLNIYTFSAPNTVYSSVIIICSDVANISLTGWGFNRMKK